jgi:hypothetical protein
VPEPPKEPSPVLVQPLQESYSNVVSPTRNEENGAPQSSTEKPHKRTEARVSKDYFGFRGNTTPRGTVFHGLKLLKCGSSLSLYILKINHNGKNNSPVLELNFYLAIFVCLTRLSYLLLCMAYPSNEIVTWCG